MATSFLPSGTATWYAKEKGAQARRLYETKTPGRGLHGGGVQKKRNMKINEQTAGGVLSGVKIYRSRTGAMVYKYNNGGVLVVNEAAARAKLYFRSISRRGFDVSKAKCGFKNIPYVLAEI